MDIFDMFGIDRDNIFSDDKLEGVDTPGCYSSQEEWRLFYKAVCIRLLRDREDLDDLTKFIICCLLDILEKNV